MTDLTTIIVKCRCMKAEESLDVRARNPGEDIGHWMESAVQRRLSYWHSTAHPECRAPDIEYVKIELHEETPIGAKAGD